MGILCISNSYNILQNIVKYITLFYLNFVVQENQNQVKDVAQSRVISGSADLVNLVITLTKSYKILQSIKKN